MSKRKPYVKQTPSSRMHAMRIHAHGPLQSSPVRYGKVRAGNCTGSVFQCSSSKGTSFTMGPQFVKGLETQYPSNRPFTNDNAKPPAKLNRKICIPSFHSPFPILLAREHTKISIDIFKYQFNTRYITRHVSLAPWQSDICLSSIQRFTTPGLVARQSSELSFRDGWTKRLATGDCIAG